MRSVLFASLLGSALSAAAAVPRVSDVAMTSYSPCFITYTLSESPGIVTFDILTNGVSIGAQNLRNAVGDVNRLVQPGNRTIRWDAHEIWSGHKFRTPCVTARVTVWPENAPPDWLAVNLTQSDCPVTYYASEAALPWGAIQGNSAYKGDILLMRRIHASHVLSFMGSPETEPNRATDGRETRRMCTLTNDFYMAIYPLTFRHYYLLNQGPAATEARLTPVVTLTYNQLRYHTDDAYNNMPIDFPSKTGRTQVGSSSYLKAWRDKTGLVLDLPTSAQWEFACRAGTDTPLYYGDGSMNNLNAISGLGYAKGYVVGTYACNSWQLYDMIGNCYEWCLDYYEDNIAPDAVTDPLGPTARGDWGRAVRGYHGNDIHKRSAFVSSKRYINDNKGDYTYNGFRLCITLF